MIAIFSQPDNNSPDTLRLDNNTARFGELFSHHEYGREGEVCQLERLNKSPTAEIAECAEITAATPLHFPILCSTRSFSVNCLRQIGFANDPNSFNDLGLASKSNNFLYRDICMEHKCPGKLVQSWFKADIRAGVSIGNDSGDLRQAGPRRKANFILFDRFG